MRTWTQRSQHKKLRRRQAVGRGEVATPGCPGMRGAGGGYVACGCRDGTGARPASEAGGLYGASSMPSSATHPRSGVAPCPNHELQRELAQRGNAITGHEAVPSAGQSGPATAERETVIVHCNCVAGRAGVRGIRSVIQRPQ